MLSFFYYEFDNFLSFLDFLNIWVNNHPLNNPNTNVTIRTMALGRLYFPKKKTDRYNLGILNDEYGKNEQDDNCNNQFCVHLL